MSLRTEVKKKNWIDWIKALVAVDIASVGVALVFGISDFHVLADLLGWFSQIIFGILYIFVAVLIFKRVFPMHLFEDTNKNKHNFIQKIDDFSEKTVEKAEHVLHKGKQFAEKRYHEAKQEFENMSKNPD